jgi:hypothetical protein
MNCKINCSRLIIILFLFVIFYSCEKDPCKDLRDGVYVYPEDKAKGKSMEETIEIFKIPDPILTCITTEGLVKTCLAYPEFRIIWAYSSLQFGFDIVESYCNGFGELWLRTDVCGILIKEYEQLDPAGINEEWSDLEIGRFMINILHYEVIIAQNEILLQLSDSEKIELFEEAINKNLAKLDLIDQYGIVGMQSSLAILSRIMFNDNYTPFISELHNEQLQLHIEIIDLRDSELINLILYHAENYLSILKKIKK